MRRKVSWQRLREIAAPILFGGIVTSDWVADAFWSRKWALLYLPYAQFATEDNPSALRSHPNQPSMRAWANDSLVTWDGTKSLSDCLESLFGMIRVENGFLEARFPNEPQVLRVVYAPVEENAPRYREVHEILLCAEDIVDADVEPGNYVWGEGNFSKFTLVAAVRLGRDDTPDFVRTYDVRGRYLVPPFDDTDWFVSDDWKLGELGAHYMLFFVASSNAIVETPCEVRTFSSERQANHQLLLRNEEIFDRWEEMDESSTPYHAGNKQSIE